MADADVHGPTPLPAPDEARLVARIAAADERALAEAYDRFAGLVYGLARRVTGSAALAEEITQEVFVFLWQHPARFDPSRGSLRSFLGAVTHRRAVDAVRRDTRRHAREEKVGREPDPPTELGEPELVADRLAGTELAQRVRDAVATLPPDQRAAIELAYFDGCTFRDVAVRLGIPEGTAKSRLRLALAKLAGILGPDTALG